MTIAQQIAHGLLHMNLDRLQHVTRRHFLQQTQTGLGAIALASLVARDGTRRHARSPPAVVNPLAPRQPHFRRQGQAASSTCTWPARRRTWTCSTTSRSWSSTTARTAPTRFSRAKRFAFTTGVPKLLGTPRKFAQHGEGGQWMSRRDAAPARRSPTSSASSSRCTPTSSTTPRRSCCSTPARRARAGRHGVVGHLRAGLREPEPARLRRAHLQRRAAQRRARQLGAAAFCRRCSRACSAARKGDPVLYASDPPGMDRDHAAHEPRRASATSTSMQAARARPPGDGHAHRAVRAGLPHADVRPRGDGHHREPKETLEAYGAAARAGELRQQLPARPPAGRAGRAVRAALRLGLGLPRHRARPRTSATA